MLPDLSYLYEYKNIHVLERYAKDYPDNVLTSEKAFKELMNFFWLSLKHDADKLNYPQNNELDFICGIHSEMKEVDDMWHTFLLFTKDYISFCKTYLGKYFHHSPNTGMEPLTEHEFRLDFTRFLSYVYDNLGEESLKTWFGKLIE